MASKTRQQLITIHISADISRKGKQTMKFGQLIEYNVRDIFFKNYTGIDAGRLVKDLFLFLKNALYKV